MMHDIAIDHIHAVFGIDRAGLVGDDGETHHGLFDLGFLQTIPGITVLCPASLDELSDMLERAVHRMDGPVAVRYPRGGENFYSENHSDAPDYLLKDGTDLTIVTFGTLTGSSRPLTARGDLRSGIETQSTCSSAYRTSSGLFIKNKATFSRRGMCYAGQSRSGDLSRCCSKWFDAGGCCCVFLWKRLCTSRNNSSASLPVWLRYRLSI